MSASPAHRIPSGPLPRPKSRLESGLSKHVKFTLPPAFQTFTCFSRLPLELQDEIWEATVNDPGVQWLRLEHPSMNIWGVHSLFAPPLVYHDLTSLDDVDADPIKQECEFERAPVAAKAKLTRPVIKLADKSWHVFVHRQMAAMEATSKLSKNHVRRLAKRADIRSSGVLKEGPREFIMLDASRDLALLEYLPSHLYSSDCGLSVYFETEHLSKFRNVAVRYHPDWHVNVDPATCCPQCGRYHGSTRAITPRHLYHFLARSFPNLETVWLVDYMMIQSEKKPSPDFDYGKTCGHEDIHPPLRATGRSRYDIPKSNTTISAGQEKPQWFRATDRTFYEADSNSWFMKERVTSLKDWLQDAYVKYSRMSKHACHKSPETVKFGILGCKHNNPSTTTVNSSTTYTRRKKRRAENDPIITRNSRRKLSLSDREVFAFLFDGSWDSPRIDPSELHYFGSGTLNGFDFNFEMGKLSLGD